MFQEHFWVYIAWDTQTQTGLSGEIKMLFPAESKIILVPWRKHTQPQNDIAAKLVLVTFQIVQDKICVLSFLMLKLTNRDIQSKCLMLK